MSKQMIINSTKNKVEIALLKDKQLVQFFSEEPNQDYQVGDFYFGKVKKLMPSLNAAFIDIGYEKTAFLHFTDIHPEMENIIEFIKKNSQKKQNFTSLINYNLSEKNLTEPKRKISEILNNKSNIIVQIAKEPIFNKGPRVTCLYSIPGRFIVLCPFNSQISISKKINSKSEKDRLLKIITKQKPNHFGIIIRTAAETKSEAELNNDINECLTKWLKLEQELKLTALGKRLLNEKDKSLSTLRELFTEEFDQIEVNDLKLKEKIDDYITIISPNKNHIVKLYKGTINIFDSFNISKQLKQLFSKKVVLPNGSYLLLEQTEALYVIDVNSGNNQQFSNQELNAFNNNIEACNEIARQLILRDIGGIIVIDFIDMKLAEHRHKVTETLTQLLKNDKAKHQIGTISKFGLLQLTRERTKPVLELKYIEDCWACDGQGKLNYHKDLEQEIEKQLGILSLSGNNKIILEVHPIIFTYFTSGIFHNKIKTLSKKFKINIKLASNDQLHLLSFVFYNQDGEKINL